MLRTSPPHGLKFLDGCLSMGWLEVVFAGDPTSLACNTVYKACHIMGHFVTYLHKKAGDVEG